MKNKLNSLFIVPALLAGVNQAAAQGPRFFRISGPTATAIIAFQPNGTMVWSNTQPGATFTVQTASSLPGGTNWVDYVQIPATNNILTNLLIDFNPPSSMALIPAGSFMMGDSSYGESDAFPVNVNVSACYMDANLVSYSQWQSVYSWATSHGYSFVDAGSGKAANHPVQGVEWYDTVKWCNARSQKESLTPVYYTDAGLTHVYTNGETDAVYPNWAVNGYRLPTEAEWEKAARGGLSGKQFPWGNTISESQANYIGNTAGYGYDLGPNGYNAMYATGALPYTSPVGSFAPNGYGLFDMAGNEYEWCWDWYGTSYTGGNDPRGPASPQNGYYRVVRGGAWNKYAILSQCGARSTASPINYLSYIGFRCVRRF